MSSHVKSLKNLLGLSLLAFFGVWMGCSSNASPVSPSNKAVTDDDGSATQVSTFTVSPDTTEVVFTDVQLHHAVRRKVKPDAPIVATITRADMLRLTTLDATNKGITSLEGLQYATNLTALSLGSNSIQDVTPLANLNKLEVLFLQRNQITDVSSLANLNKLKTLFIGLNKRVVDGVEERMGSDGLKAAVAGMPNLSTLKANALWLTDISFLEDLPKLGYLNLNGNRGIISLSPLACLKVLADLRIQRVNIAYNSPDELHPLLLFLKGEGVSVDHGPPPS